MTTTTLSIPTDESLIVRTPDTSTDYVCHLAAVEIDDGPGPGAGRASLTFATGAPGSTGWGTLTLAAHDLIDTDMVERDGADVRVLIFR